VVQSAHHAFRRLSDTGGEVSKSGSDEGESGMNEADPRVRRTRKLIVEAFVALLAEKGFHAISVQDIAVRATVNRATVYLHFEDKYALMDRVVRDAIREALTRRLGPASQISIENLRLMVVTVCELLSQFHDTCPPGDGTMKPQLEVKVQEELAAFLLGWLRQVPLAKGRADGVDVPVGGAAHEAMASLLSWAIFGAGVEWSRGGRRSPAAEWAHDVVGILIGGVAHVVTVPTEEPRPRQAG
jgi:AcrR family transcriptional regulator